MNNRQRFDDSVGKIEIIEYNKNRDIERIWTYETSWWRKLLFAIGINCYYKETEISAKGQGIIWQMEHCPLEYNNRDMEVFDILLNAEYLLTPNECIETKPESNE